MPLFLFTQIKFNQNYIIKTYDVIYDRNLNIISSENETIVKDNLNNTLNFNGFKLSVLKKILDVDKRDLEFERVINSIDVVDKEYGVEVIFDYYRRHGFPHYKIRKDEKHKHMKKQICIIPFRRDFLKQYLEMTPTILEEIESVDMMRIIEHGFKVKMVPTKFETFSVDTEKDLLKVENILKKKN